MSDSNQAILTARAFLRAHLSGTIAFDGEFVPIKVVVAPDGALIAPVMVAMLRPRRLMKVKSSAQVPWGVRTKDFLAVPI